MNQRPQLWATGDGQRHHDNTLTHASRLVKSFLGKKTCEELFVKSFLWRAFWAKHEITQVTQPPYSPDLAPCDFWLFPKLKSPLKGKRFQTIDEIQENTTGQLMAIGRTVWGPKVPNLKVTEASLSYVQYFFYLVSSSINVSIFHITWLGTFWTDLVHVEAEDGSFAPIFLVSKLFWFRFNKTLLHTC